MSSFYTALKCLPITLSLLPSQIHSLGPGSSLCAARDIALDWASRRRVSFGSNVDIDDVGASVG